MTPTESESIIGEIVEVTTTSFVAQCIDCPRDSALKLLDPPEFGAFVKIGGVSSAVESGARLEAGEEEDPFAILPTLTPAAPLVGAGMTLAVVGFARMTSLDAGRRPMALGYADEKELRMHQPQVFELITTEFSGVFIGFSDGAGEIQRRLPPRPPRLHARVALCTRQEIVAATSDISFLRRILDGAASEVPADDLAAAIVRHALDARGGDRRYLADAGTQIAALVGDDYERLHRIVRNIVD